MLHTLWSRATKRLADLSSRASEGRSSMPLSGKAVAARSQRRRRRSCRVGLEALEERALLSVCTVDRLTDLGEGNGSAGDLRYCITQAADGDSIQFAVTGFMSLTRALPDLTRSISIEGPASARLAIWRPNNGGPAYRIFTVARDVTISITGLDIGGGSAENGGGILNLGNLTIVGSAINRNYAALGGGGIYNAGSLTLIDSIVYANGAGSDVGGIGGGILAAAGELNVINSRIERNQARYGGGVDTIGDAQAVIANSTLAYNSAIFSGGAISNRGGEMVIVASAFVGNSAIQGGALYNLQGHVLHLVNSTLARNSAFNWGGGIDNEGTLFLSHCTISENQAPALGAGVTNRAGPAYVWNTIIAGNTADRLPDVWGRLDSLGYNLIGNSTGGSGYNATDLLDVDPLLGRVQNNGGPTWTYALLPGSPAIDAGDPAYAPELDQRGDGYARVAGMSIDIGAYEVQDAASPGAPTVQSGQRSDQAATVDRLFISILEEQAADARWKSERRGHRA